MTHEAEIGTFHEVEIWRPDAVPGVVRGWDVVCRTHYEECPATRYGRRATATAAIAAVIHAVVRYDGEGGGPHAEYIQEVASASSRLVPSARNAGGKVRIGPMAFSSTSANGRITLVFE